MSKLGGRCYGCGGGGGSAAEETPNTAGPSSTITVSTFGPLGRMISAEARVSVAPGNALTARADGLYVPANSDGPVTPVNETPNTGGQTTTIVVSATGSLGRSITAALRISDDAGNQLQTRQNGLYVPAASTPPATTVTCQTVKALFASGTPVQVLGEDSAGNCVKGAISVSVTPERMREIFSAPITVAEVFGVNAAGQLGKGVIAVSGAETANSAQQTPTATVSVSGALGRTIGVNVRVSSASNNQLQSLADGLFVPPPATGGTVTVDCNSVRALYADGYVERVQGVGNSSTCVSEPAAMMLQRLLVGSTFSFSNITTAGEISGLQVRIQVPGAATPVNLPGFVIPLEAVRDCNSALLGHFVRT